VRVSVIIPVHDEEEALPLVLGSIPRELVDEVVVVDNGSRDRSAAVARAGGATVLEEPRLGYGAACLRGLDHLRLRRPDVVVFLDGDGSDDPAELPRLLEPIASHGCDLVIGARAPDRREPGAMPPQARLGNWVATRLMRMLYGARFTDLGPFRAVRLDRLLGLGMRDRGCGWTVEMQVKAARRRLRCAEVPVSRRRRRGGRSKVSGTLRGTLRAGWAILWTIFRYRVAPAARAAARSE
jgi:glycosyltransferase involved in cell wall biosynthesis